MTFATFSAALATAANKLGLQAPAIGTSKGKSYEAWIMLEVIVRLQQEDVICVPCDHQDKLEPNFRVSGGPANLPYAHSTATDEPCHFKLWKNEKWLELHLGVRNRGVSDATHEIDISVVPGHDAWNLRQLSSVPYRGYVVAGAELKAYDRKHKLPHVVPRGMLGIAIDLDPGWIMGCFAMRTAGGAERVYTPMHRTYYALMTSTLIHDSSVQYLEHHGADAFSQVIPSQCNNAIDAFVEPILAVLNS